MGVLVLLVTVLGAKSKEMSLNGSTVVDTALRGGDKERKDDLDFNYKAG